MCRIIGPHFLCWMLGVVPVNTWLVSSWEENKCCNKLSKCTKWHLLHSKWSKLSFWVKKVVISSVAQLVTTDIFFSAWDKSGVKWDNSRNTIQKMRTHLDVGVHYICIGLHREHTFAHSSFTTDKFIFTSICNLKRCLSQLLLQIGKSESSRSIIQSY